jgi:hypothetical protein
MDKDIQHFGVKGMRWGVRKDSKSGARPTIKKPDPALTKQRGAAFAQGPIKTRTQREITRNKNLKAVGKTFLVTGGAVGGSILALSAYTYKLVVWDAKHK